MESAWSVPLFLTCLSLQDTHSRGIIETLITPEAFGRILCDDLDIPSNPWTDTIARQIRDQCAEQSAVAEIEIRAKDEVERNIEKDYRVILNVRFPPRHVPDQTMPSC